MTVFWAPVLPMLWLAYEAARELKISSRTLESRQATFEALETASGIADGIGSADVVRETKPKVDFLFTPKKREWETKLEESGVEEALNLMGDLEMKPEAGVFTEKFLLEQGKRASLVENVKCELPARSFLTADGQRS
jgi:hypothetical protein